MDASTVMGLIQNTIMKNQTIEKRSGTTKHPYLISPWSSGGRIGCYASSGWMDLLTTRSHKRHHASTNNRSTCTEDREGTTSWWLVLATFLVELIVSSFRNMKRNLAEIYSSGSTQSTPRANRGDRFERRKKEFLDRMGDEYGYRKSPCGFIEDWRGQELPGLIQPGALDTAAETEVYLDFAGSALPTLSQLDSIRRFSSMVLANPHSTGPAASRTTALIEQVNKRVLSLLDAHPGRYASFGMSPLDDCSPDELHPGYEIVYTSGATEALRMVSERFPFTATSATGCPCQRSSVVVYPQNSHTSVVGMRGPAIAKGCNFVCKPMAELWKDVRRDPVEAWVGGGRYANRSTSCWCDPTRHLVVLPLECNFGGDRMDCRTFLSTLRTHNSNRHRFYTLLDIAKAASTSQIRLKELNPDFAVLSFYKLFGEPTGLGCLLVKRDVIELLGRTTQQESFYFGGGSVEAVLSTTSFVAPRTEPSPLASLSGGTIHFRGIVSLHAGLDVLDRMGGMSAIDRHAVRLAEELVRRFQRLVHTDSGRPVVQIYGAWRVYNADDCVESCPGPTVTFNIVRDDGSYVGYNEVSKLAALNHPPIQFRTGCFCNPGACQWELELTNDNVLHNYRIAGHVCGDHVDIVNGRPTGAIRISFGKDSIWEDLDALVCFVERIFVRPVDSLLLEGGTRWDSRPSRVFLSELYLFPIKSCAAQRVKRWKIGTSGKLAYDREFALVDSFGSALRLQNHPQMAFLRPTIDAVAGTMIVSAPGQDAITVSLNRDMKNHSSCASAIKVCGNKCPGLLWGDHSVSEWFSDFLRVRCWLARYVNDRYELPNGIITPAALNTAIVSRSPDVAFANEQPLLLLSENAVDTLNEVLRARKQPLASSRHFRPNMVVRMDSQRSRSSQSNLEDGWTTLTFTSKNIKLDVVGPCPRCSMVDIDPSTGMKGKTLRALAEYRRSNGQINFGIFLGGSSKDEQFVEEGDAIFCD